ncbi:MAG: hypothetical protein A2Z20_07730 [Bdellovibrionales bacterium RBG_16_40_8]|nr:MAG: hypothetical protein A2Z20_07730 [Bdellovibrionales bacterium RBG_16_40_8]
MLNAKEMQDPIIFFDGVCNLCNGFVDWLLRHDRKRIFKIASLQGETAKKCLSGEKISKNQSIVLYCDKVVFDKSQAILMIFSRLSAPWSYLRALMYMPTPLRDMIYGFIARYRYKIFGRRAVCRVPTTEERKQFLP